MGIQQPYDKEKYLSALAKKRQRNRAQENTQFVNLKKISEQSQVSTQKIFRRKSGN